MKEDIAVLKAKLNMETSVIAWKELQRFFASGMVLRVDGQLDLVEVGCQISLDNKQQVEQWLMEGSLRQVQDQEARKWFEEDTALWALVVRPWVLVQDRT
ncbi:DUF2288 domain-containing protein [Endozoicomonas sp. Mp262]|uniref:DUF2288 domain-containing protein n=1 Tax=Endozoicomonas sp. Mp262 TaxID=2919499 RepID=UPI0021DFFCE4